MSNENNAAPIDEATTAEGKKGPRKVRLRDEVIADLREDITKLQAKLAKLEAEAAAEDQLKSLQNGDSISFVYGRGKNRRIESGEIIASGDNGKGTFQFKVLVGEGLDSQMRLIGAAAIVPPGMTGEEFLATFPVDEETPAEAEAVAQ